MCGKTYTENIDIIINIFALQMLPSMTITSKTPLYNVYRDVINLMHIYLMLY